MDDELRRRQIEEEMTRFELEMSQVQQALQPPPAPPAVMFIPPQMHRAAPIRPPPIPPMMMPRPPMPMHPMSMSHSHHPSPSTISAPPVKVYSAPPKKAKDLANDEIMKALKKAEAELKEAKKNKIVPAETVVVSTQKVPTTLPVPAATSQPSTSPAVREEKKPKKLIRMAGQQVWEDNSLVEWDPDDFRIFCGDLGNDVTDEMLTRVFSKYPTFTKAKVIRDKRTNKSKGYGFVSFKEPQGFIKAMRELNGKYVGSRPIKLRKSTWNERNMDVVKKKVKEKQKLGLL
ncbi:RNA-binding protein 42 [Galendromus occidentalis]|uniref:RNA-binding protein 42 n=1 Tax=Galendromus occidentalis TaxID=34638 RepID=A0AAJ6QM33_9ACAR|nr:RNA-binding protein 42 [Galendromus occidentalis]